MKYMQKEQRKRKLEKAEIMLNKAKQQTMTQQSNAFVTNKSSQVLAASCGETLSITGGKNHNRIGHQFGGLSFSASKKSVLGRASLQ